MKKNIVSLAALFLGVCLMAGCGKEEETNSDLHKMTVDKYVTVGDYTNLSISVAAPAVDQEQWDALTLLVYQSYGISAGITDRAVKMGDSIDMDYEGKLDGVPFSGGTDTDVVITVGEAGFIAGFEDGLVGAMPGETFDLELTFPENYGVEELNGKAVIFTIKVNYILPEWEDMEDSVIAAQELEEVATVEELKQYVYDYLLDYAQRYYVYDVQNALMDELMNSSVFEEIPQTFVDSYREGITSDLNYLAASNYVTADVYTNYYYGMNSEEYVNQYAEVQAQQEILLQAIANKEGLGVDDEELERLLVEYAESLEYDSVEALLADFSREECRNYFMAEKVMDYLTENAQITQITEP